MVFRILFLPFLVDSIFCWDCNSAFDPRCKDKFNNISIAYTDCSQRSLDHLGDLTATFCRKTIQQGEFICYHRVGTDPNIEHGAFQFIDNSILQRGIKTVVALHGFSVATLDPLCSILIQSRRCLPEQAIIHLRQS